MTFIETENRSCVDEAKFALTWPTWATDKSISKCSEIAAEVPGAIGGNNMEIPLPESCLIFEAVAVHGDSFHGP